MDETSPRNRVDPGNVIDALNYEVGVRGGYRRMDGYERFDGSVRPSAASYWIVTFDSGGDSGDSIDVGDTVTNHASTPTVKGEVLAVVVESGAFADNDAAGYLAVCQVPGFSGTSATPDNFSDDDTIYIGTTDYGTVDGTVLEGGATTDALHQTYQRAAIDALRTNIAVVSGEGDILGVVQFEGAVYVFRNATGGATAKMFMSSATGWSPIDTGQTASFTSGGTTEITTGTVIEDGVTSETARIVRVVLDSGSWAEGNAAGTFYTDSLSGAFTDNGNVGIFGGSSNQATLVGNLVATTLSPDGDYEFAEGNVQGSGETKKLFGVDGVNKAFSYCSSQGFSQIPTGMIADTPEHVAVFSNHLFLSFAGSVQHSSITDPYTWSVVTGAGELNAGEQVTALQVLPSDGTTRSLLITTRNTTKILYGTSASDWTIHDFSNSTGAIAKSVQRMGNALYADDRGLVSLATVDTYDNFEDATFSQKVSVYYNARHTLIVASCIAREKNQYRIFFSDGAGLVVTFDDRDVIGVMPFSLDFTITCVHSWEAPTGVEHIYAGATDGYVYELDAGTSADGEALLSMLSLHYNHFRKPEMKKRFRRLVLEGSFALSAAAQEISLLIEPSFNYGANAASLPEEQEVDVGGDSSRWNAGNWNQMFWSAGDQQYIEVRIDGVGRNLGIILTCEDAYAEPHTLYGMTVSYDERRLAR